MKNPNAIISISIGNRPWAIKTSKTLECYSNKIGADFIHIIEDDFHHFQLGEFRSGEGRNNKRAYALKSYVPWLYMQRGYSKIAIIDDTSSVDPQTPSIFDLSPVDHISYVRCSKLHAETSFEGIRSFVRSGDEAVVPLDSANYGNSGLVVYSRRFIEAFSPDQILKAKELLYNKFPHQTLLYYLTTKAQIPVNLLHKSFNMVPALGEEGRSSFSSVIKYLTYPQIKIAHITGGFKHRANIAQECAEYYISKWEDYRS